MPEKSGEIFVKFFGLRTVDGEAAFYRDATSCWDIRTGFEIDGRSKVHRGRTHKKEKAEQAERKQMMGANSYQKHAKQKSYQRSKD